MGGTDGMWTGRGERDDVIVPLEATENAAHPVGDRLYFEHWYFDARLDSGHTVVGFLQTSELVRRKPGVELHVYQPDGRKLSVVKPYRSRDAWASDSRCEVRVGDNSCSSEFPESGLPVHSVHLKEEDIEFDLTFENLLPGWKPGIGKAHFSEREFFAWVVPAPRAKVSGSVKFGGAALDASGTGYHDHNWGVGDMKRIIDHWYWGRVYCDDITLLYADVVPRGKYDIRTKPLMLAIGDTVVLSSGEMRVTAGPAVFEPAGNRDYPSWLEIKIDGALGLRLDVRDVIDAHDFVADIPIVRSSLVKPLVNKAIGRPGYFRFDSDFSLRVNHEGRWLERSGRTLHEMVALK